MMGSVVLPPITTIYILLILSIILNFSHSSSINKSSEYDKRITTIDPSGRLLQVEYAMEAAHRRSATSASALLVLPNDPSSSSLVNDENGNEDDDNNVNIGIMVYISNHHEEGGNNNNNNQRRRKLHRIDSSTIGISSGLDGDGRLLMRHLRNISHRENNYKPKNDVGCDVRVLARECGNVQHQLTLTAGARPLGVSITLLGLLPPSSLGPLGLFHCEAGGMTVDSCECTASGMGRDQVRGDLVKLLRELKQSDDNDGDGDGDGMTHSSRVSLDEGDEPIGEMVDSSSRRTTKIVTGFVKGVADSVLKRYLEQSSSKENDSSLVRRRSSSTEGDELIATSTLVDIYLVKPNSKCRGGVQISCAMSVPESDLDRVATLFAADVYVS